ncbi:hypothetical protein Suden_1390 [Sulfurimonas denitrificans DSM 1251]|uniref:Uncharacterized protein n=1 Tax=Sulfurimonas denitrificans (strain ATCC 33889 / DSM 1251) TaxID=326298 RepID=Q30QR4_SULDN|nr:hypothetical protein [Sulfurimonas denitrificans]ABB44667.1 hypothetical protein Suden_1390 [Sulfurimonas denitrificans DSM 1251]MDD3442855.1 hypothetical protein [Sulfurimonas denitrificans]
MLSNFKIKNHFFNAFRELFVHHHGSLDFRAKIFALIILANDEIKPDNYTIVKNIGMSIYKNDEERANLLLLSTKEVVSRVKEHNSLDIDTLIANIQKELKLTPRYAKKIDVDSLEALLNISHNSDTLAYQKSMVAFLKSIKEETLSEKKSQIAQDEENIESKY